MAASGNRSKEQANFVKGGRTNKHCKGKSKCYAGRRATKNHQNKHTGECSICGSKSHHANKCPHKKPKPSKDDTKKTNFESAHNTEDKEDESKNDEYFAMACTINEPSSDNILMFRDFHLDSGATSHFTLHLSDLQESVAYVKNIHLADPSTVQSKMKGKMLIKFTADEGHACTSQNIYSIIYRLLSIHQDISRLIMTTLKVQYIYMQSIEHTVRYFDCFFKFIMA